MDPKIKRYLKLILRVGISGSLILWIIIQQDFTKIISNVVQFSPFILICAVFILIFGTMISSIRWQTILSIPEKHVPLKSLMILYLKGYFYNNFLPTQMGGDLYKSIAVGNKIKDQSTALFSVFMDRFGGLLILLSLSLFGIASTQGMMGIFIGVLLFVIGLGLYFPVLNLVSKKIKFLVNFKLASEMLVKNPKKAGLILFYSFLVQVFSFFLVYVLFLGMGINLSIKEIVLYLPLTALATLIPSFNGFGTQEVAYATLFAQSGVSPEISITVSVLIHVVRLTMSLIGGILILLGKE